ncbi:hypothetical protein ABPG75_002655 [Micractinium tetrahymenae]
MAERLALQRAAEVLDCAAKYAFHSKHAALTVADLRLAGGASRHGDAAAPLPQLLRVPDAADLLCRAETETLISEAVHAAHLPSVPFELYFDVVRQALQSKAGLPGKGPLGPRAVAASLATDPGLQPMLPYLAPLLADEVGKNLGDAGQLHSVLR